jgi:hypothetical protein
VGVPPSSFSRREIGTASKYGKLEYISMFYEKRPGKSIKETIRAYMRARYATNPY